MSQHLITIVVASLPGIAAVVVALLNRRSSAKAETVEELRAQLSDMRLDIDECKRDRDDLRAKLEDLERENLRLMRAALFPEGGRVHT